MLLRSCPATPCAVLEAFFPSPKGNDEGCTLVVACGHAAESGWRLIDGMSRNSLELGCCLGEGGIKQ